MKVITVQWLRRWLCYSSNYLNISVETALGIKLGPLRTRLVALSVMMKSTGHQVFIIYHFGTHSAPNFSALGPRMKILFKQNEQHQVWLTKKIIRSDLCYHCVGNLTGKQSSRQPCIMDLVPRNRYNGFGTKALWLWECLQWSWQYSILLSSTLLPLVQAMDSSNNRCFALSEQNPLFV